MNIQKDLVLLFFIFILPFSFLFFFLSFLGDFFLFFYSHKIFNRLKLPRIFYLELSHFLKNLAEAYP
jgi:hypothetical protein